MATKSRDYWKKRFIQVEQAEHRQGSQCYAEIEKQYREAQRQIEGQIAVWYQRFADNNGVTLAEARKLLKGQELEELKWDVNEYIRYGKANAVNGQWIKQLENASAQFHINRLQALHMQMQQSLEVMFGKQIDTITGAMTSIYKDSFYRSAFEIQKGFGVGCNLAALDERTISKVINKPWAEDGKNFSERVWNNRQKLVNELNTELTRNIILGRDPQKAIDAIAKKMNVSKNTAGRLVMTEQAFFSEIAQHDSFKELGVDQYEIVATLDSRTSEICRNMDGKVFPMQQWEVGMTAPPFHVYCRSTTVPVFGDEFDNIGERAARGEDGKTYFVPANMTYKEWKKSFVDGDKLGLKSIKPDKETNFLNITDEWTKKSGTEGTVTKGREYTVDGVTYKVNGKHVVFRPTVQEKTVATVLSEKYGKKVKFVPQVFFPQGVQTPDYMIDGDRFDLKSPTGKGKNLIYGLIAKKRKQADNFIIDISSCPLSVEEIEMQIENLYISPRTGFLDKVVLMKDMEVLKVYGRK